MSVGGQPQRISKSVTIHSSRENSKCQSSDVLHCVNSLLYRSWRESAEIHQGREIQNLVRHRRRLCSEAEVGEDWRLKNNNICALVLNLVLGFYNVVWVWGLLVTVSRGKGTAAAPRSKGLFCLAPVCANGCPILLLCISPACHAFNWISAGYWSTRDTLSAKIPVLSVI